MSQSDQARYRSGAVARLVGMPVTTLRVWERRYGLRCTEVLSSGHRLYASADIQRIALLKRLTMLGYAIGSIVNLDNEALLAMEMRDASLGAGHVSATAGQAPPVRVIVIGLALAQRLQQALSVGTAMRVVAVFDAVERAGRPDGAPDADLVLMASPTLHEDLAERLADIARSWQAVSVGVIYSYGHASACDALTASGVALLRSPRDDTALVDWIERLPVSRPARDAGPAWSPSLHAPVVPASPHQVAARRYDDVTLAKLAARPTDIACECPRHIADLVMQLAHFESYSADCESRSQADAHLHARLAVMAGSARVILEDALAQVLAHEHLTPPPSAPK